MLHLLTKSCKEILLFFTSVLPSHEVRIVEHVSLHNVNGFFDIYIQFILKYNEDRNFLFLIPWRPCTFRCELLHEK